MITPKQRAELKGRSLSEQAQALGQHTKAYAAAVAEDLAVGVYRQRNIEIQTRLPAI